MRVCTDEASTIRSSQHMHRMRCQWWEVQCHVHRVVGYVIVSNFSLCQKGGGPAQCFVPAPRTSAAIPNAWLGYALAELRRVESCTPGGMSAANQSRRKTVLLSSSTTHLVIRAERVAFHAGVSQSSIGSIVRIIIRALVVMRRISSKWSINGNASVTFRYSRSEVKAVEWRSSQ